MEGRCVKHRPYCMLALSLAISKAKREGSDTVTIKLSDALRYQEQMKLMDNRLVEYFDHLEEPYKSIVCKELFGEDNETD